MRLNWDVNKQIGFLDIVPREYGLEYFKKYIDYANTYMGQKLTAQRIAFIDRWHKGKLLDVGVGSGQFVFTRKDTMGYDINPIAIKELKSLGFWADILDIAFPAYSFFDSFEHIKDHSILNRMDKGTKIFISIPIFRDIAHIFSSKHFRPDEHYWYFTTQGIIKYMSDYGFSCLDIDNFEIRCGREDIWSFVFEKR